MAEHEDLWLITLNADGEPVQAHRVIAEHEHGPNKTDCAVTACGYHYLRMITDRSWLWHVPIGEVPLAEAKANHCGIRTVDL